jgi:hypothetical protein
MSDTYALDVRDDTRAGGIIIRSVAALAAFLVILGLVYALNTNHRHMSAILAADCEPSLFHSGLPCTTQQMMITQYNAIVTPAGKQLNADTAAYRANERHNLVAAEAALTAEVATEQALDSNLAAATFTPQNRARALSLITNAASNGTPVPLAATTFTPGITVIANALIKDVSTLAMLTAAQARSSSLAQLRSFNGRVNIATAAAQAELKLLRSALAVRPTAGS